MLAHSFNLIQDIHHTIYPRFHKNDLNLFALIDCPSVVDDENRGEGFITYVRSREHLENVQRMMGCDSKINLRIHPVIELRQTETHLALEFVISPDAWWDQRNFIAKLTVAKHRRKFRTLLSRLGDDFVIGFWHGLHQDDLHITSAKAAHPAVFDQLISTYTDRDWFRVGVWYENEQLSDDIEDKLFTKLRALYGLYAFVAWTSSNDFRVFDDRDSGFMTV